ncbi:ras-related protein RGP2 [Cokeromyces recurvatus]|uniref:ras-related protein RGP2 n=1 Tax=Cokeromyces recurvatus TaxID=90255 RepID=UPI00221EEC71|nr:ras-related protein RGP2 [Cokeromyces recurvatus]KAI7903277.1 ras-related protein RGP2 [Cokeromyces recurvatus]
MLLESAYNYLFKIVIIGDSGVGKSNLLLQYTSNEFMEDSRSTIGVEFATKNIKIENSLIKAQIWDTSGQERYKAITSAFYRGAVGALLVYDITRKSSFDHVHQWLKELREHTEDTIPLVLIGNKIDLADTSRVVSTEVAKRYATEANMLFFETSARTAVNVNKAFEVMFDHVYKELAKNKILKKNSTTDVNGLALRGSTITLHPPSVTYEYNHRPHQKKEANRCC